MKRKRPSLRQRLNALAREADRAEGEMIRRWQALAPEKRTHFLRRRVGLRAGAHAATAASAITSAATDTSVIGSPGDTPNSNDVSKPLVATLKTPPATTPITASHAPSLTRSDVTP